MTKKEIINDLLLSNKITYEQAYVLSREQDETAKQELSKEALNWNRNVGIQADIRHEEEEMERVFDDMIHELFVGEEGCSVAIRFDIERCLKYMHEADWKWYDEIVDKRMFVKEAGLLLKTAIQSCIANRDENPNWNIDDDSFIGESRSSGLRALAWFEDDDTIQTELMFSIESYGAPFKYSEYKKHLDKHTELMKLNK